MLTVDRLFSKDMVLQRDKPIKFWGDGDGTEVTVTVQGMSSSAPISEGKWQVTLAPLTASQSETVLIQSGNEQVRIENVAIGEVWIAGGQSNMEFPLEYDAEASKVIPKANNPHIRFYDCPKIRLEGQEKEEDYSKVGFWRPLNPTNAPFYSAVGFYFANQIYEQLHVPVGIVGCNWGGTSASTWLDESLLAADEDLRVYLDEYQAGIQNLDLFEYLVAEKKSRKYMQSWVVTKFMNSALKKTPGPLLSPLFTAIVQSGAKKKPPIGPRSENRPGVLYHTMLQKIAGFSTRGVIWYQGEADDLKADLYAKLFSAMIRCWRAAWQDELPFLFVQLAPYQKHLGFTAVNYPILRDQQKIVSRTMPGAYMASIMDAGSRLDIHPKHKRPVGERLALLARGKVYGEEILCEAPEVSEVKVEGDYLVISFIHAGDGLTLKGNHLESLEVFGDGKEVKPSRISVAEGKVTFQAEGILSAKELEVCYAHRNYAKINLYNSAGLPAKPFRQLLTTDNQA
ncbi:MAG: sialate O-acetylesterase [Anaerolineaceae bacterium]